ncbi:MAG: class IV adenylate cyclase [Vicinamibacterales bacterium]
MSVAIEREIKLRFDSVDAARDALMAAGASPLRGRRLQEDALLDTVDQQLRARRCVLRIRTEGGQHRVTFKGPVQPSVVKVREEVETTVGDGDTLLRLFDELGYRPWFRYQKYREELVKDDVTAAIDETPVGTFVELEGGEAGIERLASALGRSRDDFLLDSYRMLFVEHCRERGLDARDMLFDRA